jgi:hypothetical protein
MLWNPRSSAAVRTAETQLSANFTGGEYQICLKSSSRPISLHHLLRLGADGRIHLRQGLVAWMAKSMVKKTLPGMVFRELGLTCIMPTVAQA